MFPKRKRCKTFSPRRRAEVKLKTIKPAMKWLVKVNKLTFGKRTAMRSLMLQRKISPSLKRLEEQAIDLYHNQQRIRVGAEQQIAISAREQAAVLKNLKRFLDAVDYAKKQGFIK